MSDILRKESEHYSSIEVGVIERAKERGEVATDLDSTHAVMLFSAPIFYRYLLARRPVDGRWITAHVDKTVALLRTAE